MTKGLLGFIKMVKRRQGRAAYNWRTKVFLEENGLVGVQTNGVTHC